MSLVPINKHLSIYFAVSLLKIFLLNTDNILISFFLKIQSIARSILSRLQAPQLLSRIYSEEKKSIMKVLVPMVLVVLLDNFNSLGKAWRTMSNTDNYFDFPCGGDNSKITVIRMVDNRREHCEGHLIHDRAALIPAQCLEGYNKNEGRLQIGINSYGMMTEYRLISNTFIHPNYDSCYGINNFAIVTFNTPFEVEYDIICMPDQEGITVWSVKSCNTSSQNYVQNNHRKKEKCRDMILHHDYYKAESRNQLVHKIKKEKHMGVHEVAYSQMIICEFDYKDFYHDFIFASTFYATIDSGKEDEYYMLYRQDYIQCIIPWVTDVITSFFILK